MQLSEDRVKRDDQHRLGEHLDREQREADQTFATELEARKRIGGKQRNGEREYRRSRSNHQ
jgi:hypothetical protein